MDLAARSTAQERMDTDCRDFAEYRRCLRDLARVNAITRTHAPTLAWLARQAAGMGDFSLLDVGCGGGDLLRRVWRWAERRGVRARLTGLDRHPWSIRAAREATASGTGIDYVQADVFAWSDAPRFDFIASSQFAHHLDDAALAEFVRWMEAHARHGWFIADLRRHPLPYYGFELLARIAGWHRFVRQDGRVSIARSFTRPEWCAVLRAAGIAEGRAEITRHVPFRLCVGTRRSHTRAAVSAARSMIRNE